VLESHGDCIFRIFPVYMYGVMHTSARTDCDFEHNVECSSRKVSSRADAYGKIHGN
jgi:hypothetical protein